ncbi:hypothetical protein OAH13_04970, partial [Flavobacteriaceae bacterium]|nr:hypothetical protein [Flavobacteriaceae bacterium]
EVEGLTQVQTQLSSLSTTVSGLSSAIAAIPTTDSTADLSGLTTDLAAAQTAIDAITAALADVADAADLAAVDAAIVALQEDVNTLLEADAVINQNVTINNSATLEYVSTLIASGDDDPNVIVNGSVTINTTTFTPAITEAQLAEVNAIAAKLATVLGSGSSTDGVEVTSATPITFTNLSFIDDDYVVSGSDMDDAALRTVSGSVTASHGGTAVAFDYSQLASIGGNLVIAAADAATATSINLSGVEITGTFGETGETAGDLTFEGAISIDLGTADFDSLTAPKATSITSDSEGFASGLTIIAGNGGTIDINEATSATNVVITGTSTTVLHMDDLASVTDLDINTVGEAHFPALTTFTADSDIEASVATALTSLVTVTNELDLNDVPTAVLTALVAVEDDLTWDVGVINIPNAAITSGDLLSSTATDVTVKSIVAITDLRGGTGVTKLTLTAQDDDLGATGDVTDLTVTADGSVDVAAAGANLVSVSLSGTEENSFAADMTALKTITLNDTATNTLAAITGTATRTVNLTGHLVAFISDDAGLAALNNTATFLDNPGNSDTPITIHIHDTDHITSIDLSSMEKVAIVDIQDNDNLATIIAPTGATNLLTANAGASFTILNNSLTASYTNSTAAFPGDGINPATPYAEACIHSPSLASWKDYIAAVLTTNATVTLDLDYDISAIAGNTNFASDIADDSSATHGGTGTVNTVAELDLFQATACD